MKKLIKQALSENDNETYCVVRILGVIGIGIVAVAVVIGAAPLEAGAGVAAVLTSIGAGARLKGEKISS
jgi:uncharacterized membrane protein YkgB